MKANKVVVLHSKPRKLVPANNNEDNDDELSDIDDIIDEFVEGYSEGRKVKVYRLGD